VRSRSPFEMYGESVPQTDAALREHLFVEGDTLTHLAHLYLGDWQLWRTIADRNGVVDARAVEPGTLLLIPDTSPERGAFESA
jgi:nucleoid-associated protein YgaU